MHFIVIVIKLIDLKKSFCFFQDLIRTIVFVSFKNVLYGGRKFTHLPLLAGCDTKSIQCCSPDSYTMNKNFPVTTITVTPALLSTDPPLLMQ